MKRGPLLYLETSIFGFCLDSEPRNALRREAETTLLEQVRLGVLDVVTSAVTLDEVSRSPEPVRSRLLKLLDDVATIQADRPEVERLARANVQDGAIPEGSLDDARHLAYATVGKGTSRYRRTRTHRERTRGATKRRGQPARGIWPAACEDAGGGFGV